MPTINTTTISTAPKIPLPHLRIDKEEVEDAATNAIPMPIPAPTMIIEKP